ncbi:MAG: ABC transporter ATP-binding protein/permease [Defluviitaleaceae bacterium]|nr:ABC transporter ATP-binding protein/permease [Defluviitaleaceae bacterium]
MLTTMKKTGMRFKGFMLLYAILATVTAVGIIAVNRLTGEISQAAVDGNTDIILRLFVFVTGVTALRAICAAINTVMLARISAGAGYKLRQHFVNYFLRVPFAAVEKAGSGESLSIYSNDIPNAESLITGGILAAFEDFIAFVSAFIFMLLLSPAFTGILFIAAVVMLVIQILLSRPLQKMSVKTSERQAEFNAVVNDSLQNLTTIHAYSLDEVLEERYMKAYNNYFSLMKRVAWLIAFLIGAMMAVMLSPLIVVFVVLAGGVIGGTLNLAEFVAFVTTIMIATGGVMQLGQNVSQIARLVAGAKRLNDNTAEGFECDDFDGEIPAQGQRWSQTKNMFAAHPCNQDNGTNIVFENITFAYGETPVLEDVSFHIESGKKIAIVGGSGSGKSTILKLLLGLYEPTSGEIRIGERNSTSYTKSSLRNNFAYASQDSFLFSESIGYNITLNTKKDENIFLLRKACNDAGVLDFIESLPNQFDSILSEAADNISGGQRQRVAMARAFYKNAPIILFDEATSALDPATEEAILASFDNVVAGKTVIMVAHRAKAIATCDEIIVMDKGKIASIGNHSHLIENCEIYRGLYLKNEREVA